MKKILSVVLSLLLVAFGCTFVACDNSGDNGDNVSLTLTNYETYLQVSSRLYGSGTMKWSNTTSSYQYDKATGTVNIVGVSGYEYIDVTVNVEIKFYFGDESYTIDLPVKLNIGGAGSCTNDVDIKGSWPNDWIQKHAGYDVKSVTGYVKKA